MTSVCYLRRTIVVSGQHHKQSRRMEWLMLVMADGGLGRCGKLFMGYGAVRFVPEDRLWDVGPCSLAL